jgi:hypothetical protein
MMGPIRATVGRRVSSGLCTEYDVERAAAQMRTSVARAEPIVHRIEHGTDA